MRKVLYLLIFLGTFSTSADAQFFVTHTSGTVNYGGVQVTVTPVGSPTTTTPVCNLAPYYIGINGASGYRYQFNPAVTHISARFYELNSDDSVIFIGPNSNSTPIALTAANFSNYAGPCTPSNTGYITPGGLLSSTSGPTSGFHAGAVIDYQNSPGTISDITIRQTTLNSAGVIMDFWFKNDTCDLDFDAWADEPICRYRDLKLNAYTYPNTTYSWTYTGTGAAWNSTDQNPVRPNINIIDGGTYTVTATRGACVYSKAVIVNVDNIPNKPTVLQYGPFCPGENDSLLMNTNIPGGGTFEWRGPNGQSFSTIGNILPLNGITPNEAGGWKMFALTTNGCSSDTTDYNVGINPPVTADFKVDSTFGCGSDTVNITDLSTGNTSNTWTFGDGSSSNTKSPTHVYTSQGTYNIVLIATNGLCSDTVDKTVELTHPIIAGFTVDDDSICQDTKITLTNTSVVTPGTVPVYTWDYANGDTGRTFDDEYTYIKPGVYIVKLYLEDYIGCTDTADTVIVVDSLGSVDFIVSLDSICVGDAIDFKGTYSPQGNTGIQWTFDDGVVIPNILDVRHVFELPKAPYSVKLDATYRICPNVSKTVPVTVSPYPTVDLGKDTAICPNGVPVNLRDRINEGNSNAKWVWNTPRKDITSNALVRHPGVYAVTVDINGCKTTDSVEVKKNCYVNIPNIFTPNGDGSNDYFLPRQLLSSAVTKFDMKIFNRWGELIFETDATNGRGWDGKVNGEFQPVGVYVYLINVSFANGTNENYQGNVTLLR